MINAIIFDLDGTLLNTIDDICDSLNIALSNEGYKTYTSEETKAFVGSGVKIMVERALGNQLYTSEAFEEIRKTYMKEYEVRQSIKTHPYEGIIDMLVELKRMGIKIGLLSNKPHQDTLRVVDHYFGLDKFDVILGQREGVPIKPDPTSLFELIKCLDTSKDKCLFVGDSDVDMKTANNGGVKKIGVLWGFRTFNDLKENNADYIVSSTKEIIDIVKCQ